EGGSEGEDSGGIGQSEEDHRGISAKPATSFCRGCRGRPGKNKGEAEVAEDDSPDQLKPGALVDEDAGDERQAERDGPVEGIGGGRAQSGDQADVAAICEG